MRNLLLSLIAMVTIAALCSGLMLMYDPDGRILSLPAKMLAHSPFKNFFFPGFVLAVLVGGTCVYALVISGNGNAQSYRWSVFAGLMIVGWAVGQMLLTEYYHWLQLVCLGIGVLVVLLAYQLMGKAIFNHKIVNGNGLL